MSRYSFDAIQSQILVWRTSSPRPDSSPPLRDCANEFVIFGERHPRYLVRQFIDHDLTERFHQGIGGRIIKPGTAPGNDNAVLGPIGCRSRLGGLLNFYHRAAA